MSTSAVIQFHGTTATGKVEAKPTAQIYRHWDGYPEETGCDLLAFIQECKTLESPRLNDPSYLAAKYVVWLAGQFRKEYDRARDTFEEPAGKNPLEFLSLGIIQGKPENWGADYFYVVPCDGKGDGIKCYKISQPAGEPARYEPVEMPAEDTRRLKNG